MRSSRSEGVDGVEKAFADAREFAGGRDVDVGATSGHDGPRDEEGEPQ
ncbi:hypothetical protein [Rubrobacter xylanophilus]|nr:hypothetical protein [Rubrobacter xylanophilus]